MLSSLSAFSKEIVCLIIILLISQILIHHSCVAGEWPRCGTHFRTITGFTHSELISPEGFAIIIRKKPTIAREKRKKQLFNGADDNEIVEEIVNTDARLFKFLEFTAEVVLM